MKSVLFALLLTAAGCTSSKITSSWTAPDAGSRLYKKIVVVSQLPSSDSSTRHQRLQMETCLAADLEAVGHKAVSFLQTFDEKQFSGLRYDSIRQRFEQRGIDGVITIRLVNKERDSIYITGKPANELSGCHSRRLGIEGTGRETTDRAGYFIASSQLHWESHFYDLKKLQLVYSVQSTSFEPLPMEKLASEYGHLVVQDLQKKYVLVATRH